jgi:hypothetical protein
MDTYLVSVYGIYLDVNFKQSGNVIEIKNVFTNGCPDDVLPLLSEDAKTRIRTEIRCVNILS